MSCMSCVLSHTSRVNVSKISSRACLINFSINCLPSSLCFRNKIFPCKMCLKKFPYKLRRAIKSDKLSAKCSNTENIFRELFCKMTRLNNQLIPHGMLRPLYKGIFNVLIRIWCQFHEECFFKRNLRWALFFPFIYFF